MASTRNRNTQGNYCLEQNSYKQFENYTLYPNSQYGQAYNTRFAGNGLLMKNSLYISKMSQEYN
jgi:hypothetical protein